MTTTAAPDPAAELRQRLIDDLQHIARQAATAQVRAYAIIRRTNSYTAHGPPTARLLVDAATAAHARHQAELLARTITTMHELEYKTLPPPK